jgi:membrane protein implicated in regulation of membrane protease activity
MSIELLWIGLAIVAAIVEMVLPSFGFIFVTGGALVAALLAWTGLNLVVQVSAFAVVLVLSLMLIRPRLVSRLGSKGVPSRTEALIGKRGRVTEDINPTLGTGRIIVAGEDWAASSDRAIPIGADVVVRGADSIVLRVTPL